MEILVTLAVFGVVLPAVAYVLNRGGSKSGKIYFGGKAPVSCKKFTVAM